MNSDGCIFLNKKMKNIICHINTLIILGVLMFFSGCKEDHLSQSTDILHSFSVKGKNNEFFRSTINSDNTVTIKVSPYLDAKVVLDSAIATFYLAKGATVSPSPSIPQNFAQAGGVKYTVTAEDGVTKKDYTISWGISDQLADGEGFSYAEIGASKNFVELGYPGEFQNFGLADSKLFGDLIMYPAYCGDHIILLSRAYVTSNAASPYGIKVVDKQTLATTGTLNLGSINIADLKLISSDYKGNCVGMVVKNGNTEFFYWTKISDAPKSIGNVPVNMASTTDGSSNFQVSGDITKSAWITAMAPRGAKGDHYRVKVINGQVESNYSTISSGYSSSDCSGFQMISALSDSDKPSFIVGDSEGASGAANSIKVYINSFAGSTVSVMPGMWQNILQSWWVGTGATTSRYGGRSPFVSGMMINGKSYALVTSGTGWWHAAAILNGDLQSLAHENLNIAASVNRGWSYGSYGDWYYDEEKKEGYLAVWFGRLGLKTFKLTCFE